MEGAQGAAGGAVHSGEGVEGAAGIKGVDGGIKEIECGRRAKGEEGEDRVGELGGGFVVDGRAEGREEISMFSAQYTIFNIQYPSSKERTERSGGEGGFLPRRARTALRSDQQGAFWRGSRRR